MNINDGISVKKVTANDNDDESDPRFKSPGRVKDLINKFSTINGRSPPPSTTSPTHPKSAVDSSVTGPGKQPSPIHGDGGGNLHDSQSAGQQKGEEPRHKLDHIGGNRIGIADGSFESIDASTSSSGSTTSKNKTGAGLKHSKSIPPGGASHDKDLYNKFSRYDSTRLPRSKLPTTGGGYSGAAPLGDLGVAPNWTEETFQFAKELAGQGPTRMQWIDMPEVVKLKLADKIDGHTRQLQEALFEIVSTEASYYSSLHTFFTVFYYNELFHPGKGKLITRSQRHHLFSSIGVVQNTCDGFLTQLQANYRQDPMMIKLMDLVYEWSENKFDTYVHYVYNQPYQTRQLNLLNNKPEFAAKLKTIESDPRCSMLSLYAFLTLPFQRITRLRLLVASVLKYAPSNTLVYRDGLVALASLENILSLCEIGRSIMEHKQRIIELTNMFIYKPTAHVVKMSNRCIVREGELQWAVDPKSNRRSFRRMASFSRRKAHPICLYLFNEILVIAKKKNNDQLHVAEAVDIGDITVRPTNELDACGKSPLMPADDSASFKGVGADNGSTSSSSTSTDSEFVPGQKVGGSFKGYTFIIKLKNVAEGQVGEYHLKTNELSDRQRWIDALDPTYYAVPDKLKQVIFEGPQMRIMQSYKPKNFDELELKEGDQVSVLTKLRDGWAKGMLASEHSGWFPTKIGVEIQDLSQKSEYTKEYMLRQEAQMAYKRRKGLKNDPFSKVNRLVKQYDNGDPVST